MKHGSTWRIAGGSLLLVVALLAGCSRTPPEVFYTLNPLPPVDRRASGEPGPLVGVGPVTTPEFLDRPQIVTRPSPNRLEVSEFHRWGGSLKDSLPRILAQNISTHLGNDRVAVYPWKDPVKPTFRVGADILQFDGRLGEAVDLVAAWQIWQPADGKILIVHRSTIHTPVTGEGYEAFVAAQSRAVGDLAKEIAEAIASLR